MRFHTSAVIYRQDPSKFWNALETCLREVTIDATRSGRLMELRGLGPGEVSMNLDDFAILAVDEQEDSAVIEADGVFFGSHLEGRSTQEAAVKAKLEWVFEQIQTQVDREEERTPKSAAKTGTEAAERSQPERVGGMMAAAASVPPREPAKATMDEVSVAARPRPADAPQRVLLKVRLRRMDRPAESRMSRITDFSPAGFHQGGFIAASIVGVALMLAGIGGVEQHVRNENAGTTSAKLPVTTARLAETDAGLKGLGGGAAAIGVHPVEPVPAEANDPKQLLTHWETAMRTRDAEAQASFYADPVERYQDRDNLGRAALEQEKEAAIAGRKGLWTVKLEGVVIEQRTPDEATVRLVKHYRRTGAVPNYRAVCSHGAGLEADGREVEDRVGTRSG
jgi:hypothetical protein